jgi:hypothetical protein
MGKLTLLAGAALLLCCGNEQPGNQAPKQDAAQKAPQKAPPKKDYAGCICPLWEDEVLGGGYSRYYCEHYMDNTDCNSYDIEFNIYQSNLDAGMCGDPCVDCDIGFARGPVPCLGSPKAETFRIPDAPERGIDVVTTQVIRFPVPPHDSVLARVFLIEATPETRNLPRGKARAPYRLFGVGYEVAGADGSPVREIGKKHVKPAPGNNPCEFEVGLGTVNFRVFTTKTKPRQPAADR